MKQLNNWIASTMSFLIHLVIYAIAYGAGLVALIYSFERWGLIITALLLPVIVFLMALLVIMETYLIRFCIPRPKTGIYPKGTMAHFIFLLNHLVFDMAVNPALPPLAAMYKISNLCRVLILRSCGARVKFSAVISRTAMFHDPYLLTIGTGATIGESVQVYSSALESGKILLFRTFIGPNAHVSHSSLLFPGTEIGEGSVLGMGSSTRNEMKIPPYELWVGNPASHLARLSRPLLYTPAPVERTDRSERYGQSDRQGSDRYRNGQRGGYRNDRGERGERDRGDRGRDRGGRDRGRDRGGRPPYRQDDRRGGGQQFRKPYDGGRPPQAPREDFQQAPAPQPQAPQTPVQQQPIIEPLAQVIERPASTGRIDTPYIGPIDVHGRPDAVKKPEEGQKPQEPQQ